MKFIFRVISFIFNFFFRTIRFITVGMVTAIALVFFINNILDQSYGLNNIRIIFLVFSFLPLFLALFVELFFYFTRRSEKKFLLSKETEYLKIK